MKNLMIWFLINFSCASVYSVQSLNTDINRKNDINYEKILLKSTVIELDDQTGYNFFSNSTSNYSNMTNLLVTGQSSLGNYFFSGKYGNISSIKKDVQRDGISECQLIEFGFGDSISIDYGLNESITINPRNDGWFIADESDSDVSGISVDASIGSGCLIVQKAKDNNINFEVVYKESDIWKKNKMNTYYESFCEITPEFNDKTFYRVIYACEIARKINPGAIWEDYERKNIIEITEFCVSGIFSDGTSRNNFLIIIIGCLLGCILNFVALGLILIGMKKSGKLKNWRL